MSSKSTYFRTNRLREAVEEMSGERGKAKKKSAIRLDDLKEILMVEPRLQSKELEQPPTAEDYNLLRQDVAAVHKVLIILAAALQKRIL